MPNRKTISRKKPLSETDDNKPTKQDKEKLEIFEEADDRAKKLSKQDAKMLRNLDLPPGAYSKTPDDKLENFLRKGALRPFIKQIEEERKQQGKGEDEDRSR